VTLAPASSCGTDQRLQRSYLARAR
jgi:hypothetical protein